MKLVVCTAVVVLLCAGFADGQANSQAALSGGYKVPNNAQYIALAPKKVFPNQVFQVYITLFTMPFGQLDVRAVLSVDEDEYASVVETVRESGTKRLQMLVPLTVQPGKHKLVIEGLISGTQSVFQNETLVEFDPKYVSLFIQTDRPIYYTSYEPYDHVKFRIAGTTPDLQPVSGPMTIYVKDASNLVVRRMFQKQLIFGIYEDGFPIPFPCHEGDWKIEVQAFGHVYQQNFSVVRWFPRRFEVNLTTPIYIFDTEFGVSGLVEAYYFNGVHKSGKSVFGNLTVQLQVRDPKDGKFLEGSLNYSMAYVDEQVPFHFTMSEIKEKFGTVTSKDLYLKAWFKDSFWEETQNATSVTQVVKDGIQLKVLGKKFRTFKPRVPMTIYIAVQRTDGTPYAGFLNRQIIISRTHQGRGSSSYPEHKVLIPDDSIVRYTITPGEGDEKIYFRALHPVTMSQVEVEMFRYWSERNRYISITTSTVLPKVNDYMVFTVRTNFFVQELNYLILASGNILLGSSVMVHSQQKTFSVALSRSMAPRARIVVYCVIDGDILVDSLNFFVRDTRLFNAELVINKGKNFRWDSIELITKGFPGAFVSTNGIDYELYKRGANTFLTEEKVIRELLTYDGENEGPYQHTWWYDSPLWESSVYFTAPTAGVDHLTTFNLSGIAPLSDMNLTVAPETHNCNATLGFGRCLSGACFELKYLCDGKIDCNQDGFDEMNCPVDPPRPARRPAIDDLHLVSRYFADNDYLWHTTYIKFYGQTEIQVDTPENRSPMVVSAFVLDPTEGLAITQQPAMTDNTRSFYMHVEGPTRSKRGEQIGYRLSMFNYGIERLEVLAMVHGSDDYRFVLVDDFGWANAFSPRLAAGDIQTMVELLPGQSKWIHFPIVPLIEEGEIEITFSAYSIMRIDRETVTLEIRYDGVHNNDNTPYLVDLVNQGSIIIPDFDILIPERWQLPNQRDLLYYPGSNKADMFIWGDVVSPGFFEDHLSTDIVGVPRDTTDGYAFDVAINMQTLKYLQIVNALTRDAKDLALKYMKDVMPRLFANMKNDGSFTMHHRSNESCLWISSFVLRTLHSIHASEWNEDLFIEIEILNKIASWMADQMLPNGSFPETASRVYSRNLNPVSVDKNGNEQTWHLATTAHVVITLAEAKRLTGNAKPKADIVKGKAAEYLASMINEITDPLQMSMVAFALAQVNHHTKNEAYTRLKSFRRESEFVYWSNTEMPRNPTKIVNTVNFQLPREYYVNWEYANIATSYALQLYLINNEYQASKPIMKWLQTQHNAMLGWSSTQDTLLVLDALTQYAYRETNRDIYQMEIRLEATNNPAWKHTIMLNSSNFATLTTLHLDRAWGQIKAYAKGTGYAYMHLESMWNTEKKHQIDTAEYDALTFELQNTVCRGRNCSIFEMELCTRWLRPDLGKESGQAYMRLEIPTGFYISRDRIDEVYNQNVPGLMWMDFVHNEVSFIFSHVPQTPVCWMFHADRWWPVANVSFTNYVHTAEYAESGLFQISLYETYSLFHNHICLVCGSFQCPFCPFFNAAVPTAPSPSRLLLMISALITIHFGFKTLGIDKTNHLEKW